jgi:hypothetical protein
MPNVESVQSAIVGNYAQIVGTIPTGQQILESPIYCGGNSFLAIQLNSTFTSGNLFFFGSLTGAPGSFYQLTVFAANAFYTIAQADLSTVLAGITSLNPSTAGIQIPLDPTVFDGVQWLQIYCSNAQASDQDITFVMAPILG